MAPESSTTSNLSKSASKKKSKREAAAAGQTFVASPDIKDEPTTDGQERHDITNGVEVSNDSPYVKELQK